MKKKLNFFIEEFQIKIKLIFINLKIQNIMEDQNISQ